MRITYTYDTIKEKRKITGVCQECDKKRTRIVSETMTESPYNKNPDGTVRTRSEIHEALSVEVEEEAKKLKENFICASCYYI